MVAETKLAQNTINRLDLESQAITAFVQASMKIKSPTKNATNPFLKNKYADLGAVIDSVKEVLQQHRIVAVQSCNLTSGPTPAITVETRFYHENGFCAMRTTTCVYLKEISPQGSMGAFTYGRRYALLAAFNMAAEDDDANEASGKGFDSEKPLKPEEKQNIGSALKGLVKK